MSLDQAQQPLVLELQNQMSAMQAALEGNSQASLFKPKMFNGFPTEDVNEWLLQFERYSKFYGWSNSKKLNALSLLLGGSASAWFQTLPNETTSDFNELVGELKKRFGSQNLEFFFRQELYSRKQGQNESLALYTEDIIKKSQRLSLFNKDMMNIFVNGLNDAIKIHVLLNQQKTIAEAENLARLRDSVSKTIAHTLPLAPPSVPAQEQRIKELESQVNLLFSLANKTPHQDVAQLDALSANNTIVTPSQAANPSGDFQSLRHEIIAAIQKCFRQEARRSNHGNNQPNLKATNTFARGRNIRTSDGRPICNACTVNLRISPLGTYLILTLFGWGLIRGVAYSRGGLIKLFDKCRIKSSFSKLLFSILLQEQYKFEH